MCTTGQGATLYQRHFDIQEDNSRSHIIVEIYCLMVRKLHTLEFRTVACTQTKLTCIKRESFFMRLYPIFNLVKFLRNVEISL
jgi:hypothetical protein